MNSYMLAMLAVLVGLLAQCVAAGLTAEAALRLPRQPVLIALAIGFALLAVHHGYTLELGLRTGLYDLRQSLIGGATSVFFMTAGFALRGRREILPPR